MDSGHPDPVAPDTGHLSARDAARFLGVHERTIRRRIAAGSLPAVKVGTSYHIPRTALERVPTGHQTGQRTADMPQPTTGQPDRDAVAQPDTGQAVPQSTPQDDAAVIELRRLLEEERARADRYHEAATIWQYRALASERELQALMAGTSGPRESSESDDTVSGDTTPTPGEHVAETGVQRSWWRFWER